MKIIKLKYILTILPVIAGIFMLACDDDKDYYDHSTTLSAFQYITNDTTIDLKGSSKDTITLRWTPSKAADYTAVMYRVLFINKNGGSFSKPTVTEINKTFGIENHLKLTDSVMNIVAESCGIKPLETGTLLWKVIASNGVAQITPDVDHKEMTLTRLKNGLAIIPSTLYLTGSASPGGNDLSKGVKAMLTDTIKGIFEFVSILKPGNFTLVDNLTSKHRSFGINGAKLEIGYLNLSPEGAEGVYRFKVDCSTMQTEFCKVTSVDQIVAGSEPATVIANLPHIGNCVWEATFTAATTLPAACSYKFRFSESKVLDGTTGYSYWGAINASGSTPPNASSPASYYWIWPRALPSGSFYRYGVGIADPRGKTVKTHLDMSPQIEHYTHSTGIQE